MPQSHPTQGPFSLEFTNEDSLRLMSLQESFYRFAEDTSSRLSKIEESIQLISGFIKTQQQTDSQPQHVDDFSNTEYPEFFLQSPAPTPALKSSSPSPLKLQFSSIETKWFTKKPYPDFGVFILDEGGRLHQHTSPFEIKIRLLSGHGLYVDHFINAPSLTFTVHQGQAVISGLKFGAVSSRNGGHFKFEISSANSLFEPAISPEFRILSERLKNEAKATSILDLSADDPLSRAPGIGKKYAQRLAECGYHTVRDLAVVASDPASRKRRVTLLETIRRDRGALTEPKLAEILREAQQVVNREVEPPLQGCVANFLTHEYDDLNDMINLQGVAHH